MTDKRPTKKPPERMDRYANRRGDLDVKPGPQRKPPANPVRRKR